VAQFQPDWVSNLKRIHCPFRNGISVHFETDFALTNTAKIADRLYWLYLSIEDGQACIHTLYVKGNTCPSNCYPVSKGAFEAGKTSFALTLDAKDQVLVESWTVNNKADGLGWVKYNLPAGCSHKKK
jgi:hypothetical protein